MRLRITATGAATPTASVIKQRNSGSTSNWSLQEKYSFNLKATETDGTTPISTVQVAAKYTGGASIFATTTDANGLITEHKADLVSAFENFSRCLGRCSPTEYDVQYGRIKDLLDDVDCISVRDSLKHVFNGMLQVAELYHPEIYRREEEDE